MLLQLGREIIRSKEGMVNILCSAVEQRTLPPATPAGQPATQPPAPPAPPAEPASVACAHAVCQVHLSTGIAWWSVHLLTTSAVIAGNRHICK